MRCSFALVVAAAALWSQCIALDIVGKWTLKQSRVEAFLHVGGRVKPNGLSLEHVSGGGGHACIVGNDGCHQGEGEKPGSLGSRKTSIGRSRVVGFLMAVRL